MNNDPKNELPNSYVDPKTVEERAVTVDPELTPEEEELLKRKIAELRKRDPFIYR